MRKQTKLVAVTSAAALLAIGASMASFAATGWVEEDGTWYFYDNDGNKVTDEWKKSGDNWYWLDGEENGAMAMDKLVDDDDDYYYVDSTGVMVKNTWVKVVNEDQDDDDDPAEYHYYYMQSNGKAYRQKNNTLSKKTIDGKQYAFDDEGIMLYGWVDGDGEMQNEETGWQQDGNMYYFGGWEDGSMKTGWQKITVYDDKDGKEDDYDYWFNFKSNGQRRGADTKKKINGKYYAFNEDGVMIYEWYMTGEIASSTSASPSAWNYFSSPEDGARIYKGWFKMAPPTEDNSFLEEDTTFAQGDSDDESERWYYADDDGLVSGQIKKIKGKYYGFFPEGKKAGRMLTGLCALQMDGDQISKVLYDDMDSDDLDEFMDAYGKKSVKDTSVYVYYFGDDADHDGALKTGAVNLNLDGDNYSFYFDKTGGAESKGRGKNGKDDDYIYHYGQKVKADSDEKYVLVYADKDSGDSDAVVIDYDSSDIRKAAKSTVEIEGLEELKDLTEKTTSQKNSDGKTVTYITGFSDNLYLVNTSGKIQDGAMTAKKDGDDWYWYSVKNEGLAMYTNDKTLKDTEIEDTDVWHAFAK